MDARNSFVALNRKGNGKQSGLEYGESAMNTRGILMVIVIDSQKRKWRKF